MTGIHIKTMKSTAKFCLNCCWIYLAIVAALSLLLLFNQPVPHHYAQGIYDFAAGALLYATFALLVLSNKVERYQLADASLAAFSVFIVAYAAIEICFALATNQWFAFSITAGMVATLVFLREMSYPAVFTFAAITFNYLFRAPGYASQNSGFAPRRQ